MDPTDLSSHQPYAYSCMMMIARGIDQVTLQLESNIWDLELEDNRAISTSRINIFFLQALNLYPTGRSGGLAELASNSSMFLKTANMTSAMFNTNYTGPGGSIELDSKGKRIYI